MLSRELETLHSQEKLLVNLTGFFGNDVAIRSIKGKEAISELYEFEVIFASENPALDLEKALGSSMTIQLKSESQERYIDGIVAAFSQGATSSERDVYVTEYYAVIRPLLWLLTLDRNYLIFQNKSPIDIIIQVLKDNGIPDVADKTLSCGRVEREYCVQHGESSYNFILRLMEDEGIFYFFIHQNGKHVLVLADDPSAYAKPPSSQTASFWDKIGRTAPVGYMYNTRLTTSVNTGSYATTDYNHNISQTDLFCTLDTKWPGPIYYDYPGRFSMLQEGKNLAKLRAQEFECSHLRLEASSTALFTIPGFSFELTGHFASVFNREYCVIASEVSLRVSDNDGLAIYECRILAMQSSVPFRPPLCAFRPCIVGTQTAVVVCPSGEEIYRNEVCAVKIHFYWDRSGKRDGEDSCWVRVAQMLSGSGWGTVFVPRVGQEVIVVFIDGNPDRPLIVGCLYNDKFLPPYSDKEATFSSWKTVSFEDSSRFHEIRFNDEKNKEELYVHAHKDVRTEIEDGNRTLDLFRGSWATTLWSKDGAVTHSLVIEEGDKITSINKGNETTTLTEGNSSTTLENGDYSLRINGNAVFEVEKDIIFKASGNILIDAGGKITLKSGQDSTMESGGKIALAATTDVTVEAMNIDEKAKVALKLGGTTAELSGQAQTKVSSPMIQIGGGMVQLG
jgi:type VI secretion system secreted protein VgrG